MGSIRPAEGLIRTGLIALALIPVAAGLGRRTLLAAGGPQTVDNARFFDAPATEPSLILGPAMLLFDEPDDASRAPMMGAGWVLNLIVAECLTRVESQRRPPATGPAQRGASV